MRTFVLVIIIFLSAPVYLNGQRTIQSAPFYPNSLDNHVETSVEGRRHNISINPLNIVLFQQIGVTYEYRPGRFGFGITPGYIYPNKQEYSNFFIAGPTNYGSLGWYSGWFVVPQVNLYLTRQKYSDEGGVLYLAAKIVYKNMHVDTNSVTVWEYHGDGYSYYRKMSDKVNMYGGFLDVGYRYFLDHFFFDLNFGPGILWLSHDMIVYTESYGTSSAPMHYLSPPLVTKYRQLTPAINFTLSLGVAF